MTGLVVLIGLAPSCSRVDSVGSVFSDTVNVSDSAGASRSIRLHVRSEREEDLARTHDASLASLARYARWFGLPENGDVTVASASIDSESLDLGSTTRIEQRVVAQIAPLWWNQLANETEVDRSFRRGFIAYVSGFVLEDLYNKRHGVRGRTAEHVRLFGGALGWSFPRLALGRRSVIGDGPAARSERVLLALEGLVGLTAMERALHVIARDRHDATMSQSGLIDAVGAISGRDLSWFIEQIRDDRHVDYAIREVTPQALAVERSAGAVFPAVEIELRFADGRQLIERWDGRSQTASFEYESPAPMVAAHIDPNGAVALDRDRLNNRARLQGMSPVAVTPWVVRWVGWMQNALMTYALVL
jgi:hypothetical protein